MREVNCRSFSWNRSEERSSIGASSDPLMLMPSFFLALGALGAAQALGVPSSWRVHRASSSVLGHANNYHKYSGSLAINMICLRISLSLKTGSMPFYLSWILPLRNLMANCILLDSYHTISFLGMCGFRHRILVGSERVFSYGKP